MRVPVVSSIVCAELFCASGNLMVLESTQLAQLLATGLDTALTAARNVNNSISVDLGGGVRRLTLDSIVLACSKRKCSFADIHRAVVAGLIDSRWNSSSNRGHDLGRIGSNFSSCCGSRK